MEDLNSVTANIEYVQQNILEWQNELRWVMMSELKQHHDPLSRCVKRENGSITVQLQLKCMYYPTCMRFAVLSMYKFLAVY